MMSYEEWKAERAEAMANRSPYRKMLDAHYQALNQNDAYYAGLGARIEAREESKVPVAGAGAVEFLSMASDLAKLSTPFTGIVGRFSYLVFEGAERLVRFETGISQ